MALTDEQRAELVDLRRLEELELKRGGAPSAPAEEAPSQYAEEIDALLAEEGGAWEQGGRGILQGLKGTGRSAANLLLPESMEPEWATKEAIRKQREIDEGSLHGWGTAGKFGGEMLALAPLGGIGWGARGLKGAQLAGKALPKLKKLLDASKLARAAVHPATAAAIEGAGAGALMADPEKRGRGALIGAGAGGALTAAARGAGRLLPGQVGGRGMVPISEAAKDVEKGLGRKLPLAMASAGEKGIPAGLAGATYRQALPMFPLARQTLAKGTGEAVVDMNESMIRKAYGRGGKGADKLVDEMLDIATDSSRGFREAIQFGDDAIKGLKGPNRLPYAAYTKMRQAMTDVSSKAGKEGFSPADVAKQLRKLAPESTPQGLRELQNMEQLLAKGGLESTAFGRRAFYSAGKDTDNLFSKLLGTTEVLGGGILTKSIASKWFQNALRKDPVLREQAIKIIGKPTAAGIRELIAAARRVASGEAAAPEEISNAP